MTKPKKRTRAKKFAEIERISILGATSRMGPVGLWVYANSYFVAASSIAVPTQPFDPVGYFLVCRSIELSLKAFLSLRGATMLAMATDGYGHDLHAALEKAEAHGIGSTVGLTPVVRSEILKASEYYMGKVFEYPAVAEAMVGYPMLPKREVLLAAAGLLVDKLAEPCKEAS